MPQVTSIRNGLDLLTHYSSTPLTSQVSVVPYYVRHVLDGTQAPSLDLLVALSTLLGIQPALRDTFLLSTVAFRFPRTSSVPPYARAVSNAPLYLRVHGAQAESRVIVWSPATLNSCIYGVTLARRVILLEMY